MIRHYLDHASTSPPRPEVVRAMVAWLEGEGETFAADPGRVHAEGRAARATRSSKPASRWRRSWERGRGRSCSLPAPPSL